MRRACQERPAPIPLTGGITRHGALSTQLVIASTFLLVQMSLVASLIFLELWY